MARGRRRVSIPASHIGKDPEWTAERLRKDFDAVVLCCGATKPPRPADRGPRRQGRALRDGVPHRQHPAPARPRASTARNPALNATGKDVVVIGGGDTGTDCVGTSLRHGCKSVVQLEILPQPPDGARRRQPVARVAEGLQDGLRPGRGRRRAGRGPAPVPRHDQALPQGRRTAISPASKSCDIEWVKDDDRAASCPKESRRHARATIPAQLVLLAMGFLGPEQDDRRAVRPRDRRPQQRQGRARATTPPTSTGVFAAGDMRRGQSLVVWAINEGRGAARECDRFLMGATNLP